MWRLTKYKKHFDKQASPLQMDLENPPRHPPAGSRRDSPSHRARRIFHRALSAHPVKVALRLLPSFLSRPLLARWQARRAGGLDSLRRRLQTILENHAGVRPVIVFPPGLNWHSQLFQRPQHLARALAQRGTLVFYLLHVEDRYPPDLEEAFQSIQERLYLCRVPVEVFNRIPRPWVFLLTWNARYLPAFQAPRVIYDYVDEIEAFEGSQTRLRGDHRKLVREAELVLATSSSLYREAAALRPDAILCPNGVDLAHFAGASTRETAPPPDLEPWIAAGRPLVGYSGALARWFDYDLLQKLALARPDLSFILLGPDHDGSLPPAMLELPNLGWLGVKPYAELPGYLRWFDAAIIPFKVSKITHATSPLKLFEYMAAGKPVVITPMQESMRVEGVLVADGPENFSRKLDEALRLKNSPQYLRMLGRVAAENTWEARARLILDAIGRVA